MGLFDGLGSSIASGVFGLASSFLGQHYKDRDTQRANDRQDRLTAEERQWALDRRNELWQREDNLTRDAWAREDKLLANQHAREDTSYQRSVQDAMNAGLSPLAVSQLDAAGVPVQASNMSDSDVGSAQAGSAASSVTPASYLAGYNHFDLSQVVGSFFSQKNLDELRRHNKQTESLSASDIDARVKIAGMQIDSSLKQLSMTIDANASEHALDRQAAVDNLNTQIAGQLKLASLNLEGEARRDAIKHTYETQGQTYQAAMDMQRQYGIPVKVVPVHSWDEYQDVFNRRTWIQLAAVDKAVARAESEFVKEEAASKSDSTTDSSSYNGGIGVNAGKSSESGVGLSSSSQSGAIGKVGPDVASEVDRGAADIRSLTRKFFNGLSLNGGMSKLHSLMHGDSAMQSVDDRYFGSLYRSKSSGYLEVPILVPSGSSVSDIIRKYR